MQVITGYLITHVHVPDGRRPDWRPTDRVSLETLVGVMSPDGERTLANHAELAGLCSSVLPINVWIFYSSQAAFRLLSARSSWLLR